MLMRNTGLSARQSENRCRRQAPDGKDACADRYAGHDGCADVVHPQRGNLWRV